MQVNFYYPFVDHMITHLSTRFPSELTGAFKGSYLVPGRLELLNDNVIDELVLQFADDLPSPGTLKQEVILWRSKWTNSNSLPSSLNDACLAAKEDLFPNIYSILSLLLTLPVGTCTNERSFSSLRRLKTWSRTTMEASRLNGLALLYVHRNLPLKPIDVLKNWDASDHRRINLAL